MELVLLKVNGVKAFWLRYMFEDALKYSSQRSHCSPNCRSTTYAVSTRTEDCCEKKHSSDEA